MALVVLQLLSLRGMQWRQRQCLPGLILSGGGGSSSTGGAARTSPSVNHFVRMKGQRELRICVKVEVAVPLGTGSP